MLVYPQYPATFWSFKHILKFVSKKAAFPPLGLLTVAAMLPNEWEKKVVDMNVTGLKDKDIQWADYVFLSAMITQKESVIEVIERCNRLETSVVAGGPVFTTGYEEFEGVDHFVLGEAETVMPQFVQDLRNGCAEPLYQSEERPNVALTPIPAWDLIKLKNYFSMPIQYSRGCPFDCEFCDIVIMNGRIPRTKSSEQLLGEFDFLYEHGWRGSVFIVDDNFIGNKAKVKEILPEIILWQRERKYPFLLFTEASLNLADDDGLMGMMVDAGFDRVFIGLETPSKEGLAECNKFQNEKRDMGEAVRAIQHNGMQVLGGFIVGFDSDPESIFDNQINFIQNIGVVTAMVGILTALPKTRLYNRLKAEGRLLKTSSGDNTDGSLNFIPKMDSEKVINGYQRIIQTIYSPKQYYERIGTFLDEYRPIRTRKQKIGFGQIRSLLKSVWYIGIIGKADFRWYYWKIMSRAFFKHREAFPEVVTLCIYGLHFRKVTEAASRMQLSK